MDLKQAALAHVNRVRQDYNIGPLLTELPIGEKASGERCPVAAGIGAPCTVGAGLTVLYDHFGENKDEIITNPPAVTEFVEAFDGGEFPELEL